MKQIKIYDYQYEELIEKKLFINKYSLDLKYLYEMNRYWKEFSFDLLNELYRSDSLESLYDFNSNLADPAYLLTFLKNNYKMIIEENKMKIDFRDYTELNDYITLEEWLKEDNHFINKNEYGIFLLIK